MSYTELAALADAEAAGFPRVPTLMALAMRSELESVVRYLAALRSGNPVILVDDAASVVGRRIIEAYAPWLPGTALPTREGTVLHPDLAVLLSTSGTTGSPKLVRLSAENIDANARSIGQYLEIGPDTRAITTLPLHYSYGLSVLNSHLAAGASVVLNDESVAAPGFWRLFETQAVTSMAGVPFVYELLESIGFRNRVLPKLRTMTQAGGRMPPAMVRSYAEWAQARGIAFFVMYGQTEATARMAYLPPAEALTHGDCIGVPIPDGRFHLVDEAGAVVEGAGQPGELVYSGPNVMMGYAVEPGDLARGTELAALHTGDLAERTPEGLYRIVGRRSRFVKPYGLRVSLDEIEAVLEEQGISAMAAGADDLVAVAFVGDGGVSEAAMTQRLADIFKLPPGLFDASMVPALPHLATGKRDYQGVMTAARARRAAGVDAEDAVGDGGFAATFAAVLRRPRAAPEDSFNAMGGDSLSYVSIVTAIDERLGHVPEGWEDMTIAELDRMVAAKGTSGGGSGSPFGLKAFDSEIVLRALAIIAVVLTHSKSRFLGGGSDALMILAGYNLARFNFAKLTMNGGLQVLRSFGVRIVLPYYLILIGYAVVHKNPGIASFFLVANNFGRFRSLLTPFWFIEALTQAMVIMVLIFAVPAARRMAAASPLRFAAGLLLVSIAVRAGAFSILQHARLLNTSVDAVFPLFALGWMMFFARDTRAKLFCVVAAIFLGAINARLMGSEQVFGGWTTEIGLRRAGWIVSAAVLVLFLPRVRLPRMVGQVLTAIAAISFTIYLTHIFPAHVLAREFGLSPVLVLPLAIAFGFLVHWSMRWFLALPPVDRIWSRLKGDAGRGVM